MPLKLFYDRLALESPHIDQAIATAIGELPAPARPMAAHIIDAGGKRLRPLLTVLAARLAGYERNEIYRLAACMEMLHAATLLHDDVLDNAATRRGKKAAHALFGIDKAILAGDALLAGGNAIVASFNDPALCICYSRATAKTAAGEILEMDSLRRPDLSLQEYLDIARGKTACLISQSCLMGALAARATARQAESLASYGENLGIGFQLVDDALDFASGLRTGKPLGGDLREGKLTPPLRFYRDSLDAGSRQDFDDKFIRNSFSEEELEDIIAKTEFHSEAARSMAGEFLAKAKKSLEPLPNCSEKEILNQIADFIAARDK